MKRKILKTLTVSALIFIIVTGLVYFHFRPGVKVIIVNNTGQTLPAVSFYYHVGGVSLSDLKAESSFSQCIRSNGESDLKLHWTDAQGHRYSKDIEVYMEPGYRGSLEIIIDSNNNTTWIDKIISWPN